MKRFMVICAFIVMFLFSTLNIFGQGFTGPSSNAAALPVMASQPITIMEVRNLPHDSFVILNGNIAGTLPGGKNFTFRDSTGEIAVEIGSKHWRGLSVIPSDSVVIYGEVKIQRGHASIKVHAITGTGRVSIRQGQPVMVSQPVTIMEARNLPQDSFVILNGNIVNALPGGKNYTFSDPTGEIIIDIGSKHWRGLAIGVYDKVEIYSEVKVSKGQVTLNVHAISLL